MEKLLAFVCVIVAGGLLTVMWRQARNGSVPLLSARNFFLVGFILFQLSSAAISFFTGIYWELTLSDPAGTGVKYMLWVSVFLGLFFLFYHTGWLTFGLQRRLVNETPVPNAGTMLGLSLGFLAAAIVLRFVIIQIPIIGVLAAIAAISMASVAAGMVCWVWSRQPANPVYILFAAAVVLVALGVALYQNFGRRDLVNVIVACLWGAFHGHFKFIPWRRAFVPFLTIGAAGFVLLAAYTATRSEEHKNYDLSTSANMLLEADVKSGVIDLFSGQGAAAISMWLMESRPENFPYDTLHTAHYALTQPVPRIWYEGKPEPLGQTMVPEAGIMFKSPGFSVGPGILGHIANDNPLIALWLYPILLAVMVRVVDDVIRLRPSDPFMLLPIGVALGDLTAIARGEAGLFTARILMSVGMAYIGMRVVSKLLILLGMKYSTEAAGEPAASAETAVIPTADDGTY